MNKECDSQMTPSERGIHLSVVSPVYGAPNTISELCRLLHIHVGAITENYEIILVFDCSADNSWDKILDECRNDSRVKGIRLSRNFGQHYAITAGLKAASGEWIVVMDCDLQDKPEEIPNLHKKACEGWQMVVARRELRQDSFFKKLSSQLFYSFFSYMTNSYQDPSIANFGIYNTKVVSAILSMGDKARFLPVMAQWVGFSRTELNVVHSSRAEGRSSYNWYSLFKLAFDIVITYSNKPLKLSVYLGMSVSLASAFIGFFYLFRHFTGGIVVSGFTTLILSIWFLSGIIIFLLGMIGVYLGRSYDQSKNRPVYIISEMRNIDVAD